MPRYREHERQQSMMIPVRFGELPALSGDTRPHFTTIAHFISSMGERAVKVFTNVFIVCYAEGLTSEKMFAVDGCKISSNCSKERDG